MKTSDRLTAAVRGLGPSATLAINELSAELIARGREVFRLGLGQSPFPVPQTVVATLREYAAEKDYLPVNGLPSLRSAVARYHQERHDLECDAENIVIGPGSKQLLFFLQVIHGGELLLPTPCWVSYAPQAMALGRTIRFLPTRSEERWRLQPQDLDKACAQGDASSRILILNYPCNPTGETYSADELAAIAEVARKHNLIVVADEIYGELNFANAHVSLARFYPEGTIVSAGLSKWCGAGGWRLGTFLIPSRLRWLQDAMAAVASESHSSVSAPIQYAAVRAYAGGTEIERYLHDSRRIMAALLSTCSKILRTGGLRVVEPRGGFYLLADFGVLQEPLRKAGITSGSKLCERLLEETGVALLPGSVFGRAPEELTVRAACVDFDGANALNAAGKTDLDRKLDSAFLSAHCTRVLDACESLVHWCQTK